MSQTPIFLVLGKIEVRAIEVVSYSRKFSAAFAQHARILGKPRVEKMAINLDDFSLELAWHAAFASPAQRLAQLHAAFNAQQPLPLVLGNGEFLGTFVISEIDEKATAQFADGTWFAGGARLSFLEYVGELPDESAGPPVGLAIARIGVPLAAVSGIAKPVATGLPAKPVIIATGAALLKDTVTLAKQVGTVLNTAQNGLRTLQTLANNPAYALEKLPGMLGQLNQTLAGSTGLHRNLTTLLPIISNGAQLGQLGLQLNQQVRIARTALQSANAGNLLVQVGHAMGAVGQASAAMDALGKPLADIAVSKALRLTGI